MEIHLHRRSNKYRRNGCIALFSFALYFISLLAQAAGELSLDTDVNFSSCSIGSGPTTLRAQCASIKVPLTSELDVSDATGGDVPYLNANNNSEQTIELSIARIPARKQSKRQDAFTLISGGPGQSAIDTFPSVSFAFRHIMRDHDVILIDQRGTGASTQLSCDDSTDSFGLDVEVDLSQVSKSAKECLEALPHPPVGFTTSMAVRDLEYVRYLLGVSQWNMYGISYGTRVALHYLRRFPTAVRTLILDAVLPPTLALGPEISVLSQRALDLIFKRCTDNQGCFEAFGDLSEPTLALMESLENTPRTIEFEDIATGKLSSMEFTREHLAVTIRLMSYSAQTAAILPSMLHDAIVNDNFAPLARQSKLQASSLGDSLATGMHHAVVCSEDAPYINAEESEDSYKTYLGPGVIESMKASCAPWPVGIVDEDFKQEIKSSAPVLILSGEADPITPPAYGELLMESLTNAKHIINAGQGHMQAPFGCVPILMAQFVETASPKKLDVNCLQRLRATPFFVDANGPLP